MLLYLLKSTACLVILMAFYKLMLEQENMHHFKRFFLLGALAVSFIVPSIVFTEYVEIAQNTAIKETPLITQPLGTALPEPFKEQKGMDRERVLWCIYAAGALGFGSRFLWHLFIMGKRIRNNPKIRGHFITKVLLNRSLPPHTFFSYIFLNKRQFETGAIPPEVVLHEETHARQWHSLDVLFIELVQVALWFNPLVYVFKHAIKLNHEFLADQAVVQTGIPKKTYQSLILAFASNTLTPPLGNSINYSSIKKRISVMKKNTSKKSALLRSVLLLPLVALLLYGFTETKTIQVTKEYPNILAPSGQSKDSDHASSTKRLVKLAGLVVDSEKLTPISNVTIYDSKGKILSRTDENGYYKIEFEIFGPGEIFFEFTLDKPGYSQFLQKEHWGNLPGTTASAIYIGLQRNTSDFPEISMLAKPYGLDHSSISSSFQAVKNDWLFEKKVEEAKKKNQDVFMEIDGNYYLVNDSWIKLNSKDDLITIDDKQTIPASKLNRALKRNKVTGMSPLESYDDAQFAIYTIPGDINDHLSKRAIEKYNTLAKKYNAIPIGKRIIPVEDLKILETIFESLDDTEKEKVQPLPEDVPDKNLRQTERKIEVRINRRGQLLVDDRLMDMEEFKQFLINTNLDLSKKERQAMVLTAIIAPLEAPKKIVEEVETIVKEHGTFVIDYINVDHKIIPGKQEGITDDQLQVYNTLAQKYNAMIKKGKVWIEDSEIDRMTKIYNQMSEAQKDKAEPFPDFPPPPPVPKAPEPPKNSSDREYASYQVKKIIEEQDPYDVVGNLNINQINPSGPTKIQKSEWVVTSGANRNSRNPQSPIVIPPVAPTIAIHVDKNNYSENLKKLIKEYLESNKMYESAIEQYRIAGKDNSETLWKLYNETLEKYVAYYVLAKKEGNFVQPVPAYKQRVEVKKTDLSNPPTPPAPASPVEHLKEMAKKGAVFMFNGKEISSDKAIEILKNNNKINIDSRSDNGKHTIHLSTKPIKIGYNSNSKNNFLRDS